MAKSTKLYAEGYYPTSTPYAKWRTREFNLRMRLVLYGECCGHLISERSQSTLDYREVNLGEFRNVDRFSKNQVRWYENDVDRYRVIVEKMNDLCGYNQ